MRALRLVTLLVALGCALPLVRQTRVAAFGFACGGTDSVTASGSYGDSTAAQAFDCDDSTARNAGDDTGWLVAHYPQPQTYNGVQLTVNAQPATDETYTISVSSDGSSWQQVAQATRTVGDGDKVQLDPITFDSVTFSYLRIDVDGKDSWVAVNEVVLLSTT